MYQFQVYDPLPSDISCKSWCIYSVKDQQILCGSNQNKSLQIASLTKMMTFLVAIRFCNKHSIDMDDIKIKVSKNASAISGTSAGLKHGDLISIKNMLYCLMLPSGNDAAYSLAESIGSILYKTSKGLIKWSILLNQLNIIDISKEQTAVQQCSVMSFVNEMNSLAVELGLKNTNFSNPHGLPDKSNVSSAIDVINLSVQILKEDNGSLNICKTKEYSFNVNNCLENQQREIQLQNTNKLLQKDGYLGLKTGFTTIAGGCLSTLYKWYDKRMATQIEIIIVVLKSECMELRFNDTEKIIQWYIQQLKHKINERCKFYEQSIKEMDNNKYLINS